MMSLLIAQKYRHRQKILCFLQRQIDEQYSPNAIAEDLELTLSELAVKCNLSEQEILKQIDFLHAEKEIEITEREWTMKYLIVQKGTIAFYDGKYIRSGWKSLLDSSYDVIKIVSAIVLLGIAVFTFITNIIDTKRNKREIETMRDEIERLKKMSTMPY